MVHGIPKHKPNHAREACFIFNQQVKDMVTIFHNLYQLTIQSNIADSKTKLHDRIT